MRKAVRMIAIIVAVVVVAAGIALAIYRDSNLHHDEQMIRSALAAGFEEKQANVNGATINYVEGPDAGPALLLIHGQGMEWEDYAPVLPDLAKRYHVFAVDCFGHGESSHDRSLYTCAAGGDALIEFARQVIGTPYAISGHSSGGILAAYVAANDAENVAACVLEDPPFFRVTPEEVQEGAGAFVWFDGYLPAHAYCAENATSVDIAGVDADDDDGSSNSSSNAEARLPYPAFYAQNSYLFSLFGGLQSKLAQDTENWCATHPGEHVVNEWIPRTWIRGMYFMDDYDPAFGDAFFTGSWMEGINQGALLRKIECPTIYLKAETSYGKDGVLYAANTDEDAAQVQSSISQCNTITIKSGHDIHQEKPSEFIRAIDEAAKTPA